MTDSATITVNVMGTFSEKNRPNNGLERVARYLNANRLSHVPIVAEIGFHKNSETLDGHVLTIKLLATEPGVEPDGSDPNGFGKRIRELLDEIRKHGGKGAFEETLFSIPRDGFDFDAVAGEPAAELDGQTEIVVRDGREVPEASAEEVMAERAEAKAEEAETPEESAAIVDSNLRAAGSEGLKPKGKPKPTTEPFKAGDDA